MTRLHSQSSCQGGSKDTFIPRSCPASGTDGVELSQGRDKAEQCVGKAFPTPGLSWGSWVRPENELPVRGVSKQIQGPRKTQIPFCPTTGPRSKARKAKNSALMVPEGREATCHCGTGGRPKPGPVWTGPKPSQCGRWGVLFSEPPPPLQGPSADLRRWPPRSLASWGRAGKAGWTSSGLSCPVLPRRGQRGRWSACCTLLGPHPMCS